jgi:hypothetical protein
MTRVLVSTHALVPVGLLTSLWGNSWAINPDRTAAHTPSLAAFYRGVRPDVEVSGPSHRRFGPSSIRAIPHDCIVALSGFPTPPPGDLIIIQRRASAKASIIWGNTYGQTAQYNSCGLLHHPH